MTEPAPKSRKLRLADVRKAGGLKRKAKKPSSKAEDAEAAPAPAAPAPRRRIKRDDLPWKKVNTSILPGMDAGGGMMMLEELDGVAIEWEEDGRGGRTARFVVSWLYWAVLGLATPLTRTGEQQEGQGQGCCAGA